MIKISGAQNKMYGKILLLCLSLAYVQADGEFSILNSPKSIRFKGDDVLPSTYVGDVLYASVGNAVATDAKWSGMYLDTPFDLAKFLMAVHVDGVDHMSVDSAAKSFKMEGAGAHESVSAAVSDLTNDNGPVCDVNFSDFDEALRSYQYCFGEMAVPKASKTKFLKPAQFGADKAFLQSLALMQAAAQNLPAAQKVSNYFVFRISLEPIAQTHGEKSDALLEASKMLSNAIAELSATARKTCPEVLSVVIASNSSNADANSITRTKRQAEPTKKSDPYNLAINYNENYPIIFNICLWFAVALILSLIAICYVIGTMDPGRDSIIYRMTSTRMKKDN